jgi:uncharacterized protein (DUF885 family)
VTPVFRLCDDYVRLRAVLDPVGAGLAGLREPFKPVTDFGPDGIAAQAGLIAETLAALDQTPAALDQTPATSAADQVADQVAGAFLRERLEAEAAWYQTGEPFRLVRAVIGPVSFIRDSVDLLPRDGTDDWRNIAARMSAIPSMLDGYRATLEAGLGRGLAAARRQALGAAKEAAGFAGTHDALLATYGTGPLAAELAFAAGRAYQGYAAIARYLREEYAPRADPADAVGAERYAVASRLYLGAAIDPVEAYEWGWEELHRIEAEMAAEARSVAPGASIDEATAILDESVYVTGADAYRAWLQERHDQAVSRLNGSQFDIPGPLRTIEVVLAASSTVGGAYYTEPSEDLTRPGRTWWSVGGRERFSVWRELRSVFHEGVPGHHLQHGAVLVAGDSLSRFAKTSFVSGHGEGWALYAERLADELGWYTEPGTRLGMLQGSALRAARVVIDIGLHLDLPLPDGSRWSFEKAGEVLRDRGRTDHYRVGPEVIRYCGMPGQAPSYKLGERAWLAARAEAMRRPDFDLRRWHAAALALGPIGLDGLAEALRGIDA